MLARLIAGTLILLFPAAAWRPMRATRRVGSGHSCDAIPATPSIPMRQRSCKVRAYTGSWDGGPRPSPGFVYSDAMREKGAAGLIWDATTLERYITDPESVVAGTIMSAPPLRDEQERTDLIAYLALSGPYSR